MPTMVLLALFSLLLLAVVVLVVALYLLDNHADQQSKRLQHLMQVSGKQRIGSLDEAAKDPRREALLQTCHICAGMQNKRPHGFSSGAISDAKNRQFSWPWSNWLAMKERPAANVKRVFESLSSCHKSQTNAEMKERICSLVNSLRLTTSVKEQGHGFFSASSAVMSVSAAASSGKSCDRSVSSVAFKDGGTSVGVADTISSRPSSLCTSCISSLAPSNSFAESIPLPITLDDEKSSNTDGKPSPLRRLVLEILMSPAVSGGGESQTGSSSSTSGLKLKLESNAAWEHLDSHSIAPDLAFKLKDAQKSEQDAKDVNVARLLCLPLKVMPDRSDTTQRDQNVSMLSQSTGEAVSLPKSGFHSLEFPSVESSAGISLDLDSVRANKEFNHADQKLWAVPSSCPCLSCQKAHGDGGLGSVDAVTSLLKHAAANGKVKFRINTPPYTSTTPSDLDSQSNSDVKSEHTSVSEDSSCVSLDALSSLCITLLKAGADGKMPEDGLMEMGAQVASVLAALNVNSVSSRGGSGGCSGSGNMHNEKFNNVQSSSSSSSLCQCQDEVVQRDRIGAVCDIDEGQELVLLQASKCRSLDGSTDRSKIKEKKKKKNRGKKQKGKAGLLISEAQHEIGKIALEVAKPLSGAIPETENGCVCGTPKGGLHCNSCPYPFTSSGSMLQRKIKEQYDELVRSNAAKTLTLAQVGRFTTCLVEAKAALQQKSELIHRKFSIAKSLLGKADKSSFDRLCGQIYGLEMEHKKLEEDTMVYNRLQEQLKLSPAYQKMLEYGRAHFELQPHTGQMIEKLEPEDMEMSFEELLAQEKKDAFWQKHGLPRSSMPVR